ncbi:MAG: hypothetical protein KGV43_00545 [Arcobacter sp.]|nr:hypothetical protein [Arcobacter sp.]
MNILKKVLILVFLSNIFLFANDVNMKNCEQIKLSKYTTLVSCHQIDYIIEYKFTEEEEEDNIKQIIAITPKDKKIILGR